MNASFPSLPNSLRLGLALLTVFTVALTAEAQIALQMESATAGANLAGLSQGGAVSADGSTFVYGTSGSTSNFIWNTSTGSTAVRFDAGSNLEMITGVSGDGGTVVGYARTGASGSRLWTPYIWREGTATALATPTVFNKTNTPEAVSYDGNQVGLRFEDQYYTWTEGGGLGSATDRVRGFSSDGTAYITDTDYHHNAATVPFPDPSGLPPENGHSWVDVDLRALSANGQVAIGSVFNDVSGAEYDTNPDFRSQAVRWTEAGGYELLGYIAGFRESDALNASADGNIITGMYGPPVNDITSYMYYPFIWDPVTGMRPLGEALTAAGLDVTGWEFLSGAIAADGSTIVGTGLYNGASMIFRVTDYAVLSAVPEPAANAALAGLAAVGLAFWRRRSHRRKG